MTSVTPDIPLDQRLSGEAHQRIRDAHATAEANVLRATAAIGIQYASEYADVFAEMDRNVKSGVRPPPLSNPFVSFEDYCLKNATAAAQLGEARIQAARIVSKAIIVELSLVASGRECWQFVQNPTSLTHQMSTDFKLSELQRQALWAELKIDPGFEGITKPHQPTVNPGEKSKKPILHEYEKRPVSRAVIELTKDEIKRNGQIPVASDIGIAIKTLKKLIAGEAVTISVADKVENHFLRID